MWKLLIVDNDSVFVSRLKNILLWKNYDIEFCTPVGSSQDAVRRIEILRPEIIISEINPPQIDGLKLLQTVRRQWGPIPVFIILTSRREFSYVREAMHYGAIEYLLKSELTGKLLAETVTSAIDHLHYLNMHQPADTDKAPFERTEGRKNDHKKDMIAEIKKYIRENVDKKLSLSEVADVFALSPNYLSSIFKKNCEYSFTQYINHSKIDEAKKMLSEGKLKIYEISERLGYEDAFYFSKVFKKIEGCSPKEYLQILKK